MKFGHLHNISAGCSNNKDSCTESNSRLGDKMSPLLTMVLFSWDKFTFKGDRLRFIESFS